MTIKKKIIFIIFPLLGSAQPVADLIANAERQSDLGNYKESKILYEKALGLSPKNTDVLMGLSYCYFSLNQYDKCVSTINKIPLESLVSGQKWNMKKIRGTSYAFTGKYDKAISDLDQYLAIYFDSYLKLVLAQCYLNKESPKMAIRTIEELMQNKNIDSTYLFDCYKILSYGYLEEGQNSKSVAFGEKAFALDSTDHELQTCLVQGYQNESKYDLSDSFCYRILKKDSTDRGAKYFIATNSYYRKDYKTAINNFNIYFETKWRNNIAVYYRGCCYRELQDYTNALADIKKYIALEPKDADGYNQYAWICFLAKKYQEGLPYANKALSIDSTSGYIFDTRGCLLYKLGNYNKALKDLNRAIKLDTSSTNSYYYRGLSFLKLNKTTEACNDLRIVVKDETYKEYNGEKPTIDLIHENCRP